MKRLKFLKKEDMNAEQLDVYKKIIFGPRGKFGGPFPALLKIPKIADLIQELGSWLRFNSKLPAKLREIVILNAAHEWRCYIEWEAHEKIAKDEGISENFIESIKNTTIPENSSKEELTTLLFCRELQKNKFISNKTFLSTNKVFTIEIILELTVILGYYTMLSMILNVFEESN